MWWKGTEKSHLQIVDSNFLEYESLALIQKVQCYTSWCTHLRVARESIAQEAFVVRRHQIAGHIERFVEKLEVCHIVADVHIGTKCGRGGCFRIALFADAGDLGLPSANECEAHHHKVRVHTHNMEQNIRRWYYRAIISFTNPMSWYFCFYYDILSSTNQMSSSI